MTALFIIIGVVIGAALFTGVFYLGYYSGKDKVRKQMDEFNKSMLQKPGRLASLLPSVEDL